MSNTQLPRKFTRRGFLKLGGGLLAAATGAYFLPKALRLGGPAAGAAPLPQNQPNTDNLGFHYHLAATDGWVYFPGVVAGEFNEVGKVQYLPDPASPAGAALNVLRPNTYAFGFRNVTDFSEQNVRAQANKVQGSAPWLYAKAETDLRITLSNLGLIARPDLTDGHTIHFHGFPNAIPVYDGVPELSVGVPIGDSFTYYYQPHDPGTYMYHCHFEDVEHISMGMTGVIFVQPAFFDRGVAAKRSVFGFTENDVASAASRFDREFPMVLTEVWAQERWRDAHIQENDWSDYKPDFWAINGRVYPDTTYGNGGGADEVSGDLIAPAGHPELQYQPLSALVTCNAGERVLIRLVNLGFQQQTMRADGITFSLVGRDAKYLGPQTINPGAGLQIRQTDAVDVGVGESYELIFTAPDFSGGQGNSGQGYDRYLFHNANLARLHNPGAAGRGGQMTEIRVYPGTTVPLQTVPNENFLESL